MVIVTVIITFYNHWFWLIILIARHVRNVDNEIKTQLFIQLWFNTIHIRIDFNYTYFFNSYINTVLKNNFKKEKKGREQDIVYFVFIKSENNILKDFY